MAAGKKIKERMADLERRAGTDGNKTHSSSSSSGKKAPKSKKSQRRQPSPPASGQTLSPPQQASHNPFTPPMHPEDHFFPSPSPPASSPPASTYQATYSPPSDSGLIMPPFGSPQTHPISTTAPYQFGMVSTTAPTLPPMTFFADAYKAPNLNGGNESMSSFLNYGDYQLGVNPSHYDSNPHVSSLRHVQNQHNTLPPFGSSAGAPTGSLAAPVPFRPRYPPPPPPSRS